MSPSINMSLDIENCVPTDLLTLQEIISHAPYKSKTEFLKKISATGRKFKCQLSKETLLRAYWKYYNNKLVPKCLDIEQHAVKLSVRSYSGVVVITVVLKPFIKSCTYDCFYCADERIVNGAQQDVPRSYHSSEPAVKRAIKMNYGIASQFRERARMLKEMGHKIDKVEVIFLGGTFSVYERIYQKEVFRETFWAANTLHEETPRDIKSLELEQLINETANVRIIGMVVETRPDCITNQELTRYRQWGVTRVQIGVQHTDNNILAKVNRRHSVEDSIKAIQLLKDWGFKVDIHIMPDLPGATPESDIKMFRRVLLGDEFCADYMKIYPCLDVTFSKIRKWKETGEWTPYAEEERGEKLIQVLMQAKSWIPPYLRINRLQRDFVDEDDNTPGFRSDTIKTNLRQILLDRMAAKGKRCRCIRCREVKDQALDPCNGQIRVTDYPASNGHEYFIEWVDIEKDVLFGFIRLRLPNREKSQKHWCHELRNAALIRELHVYGRMTPVAHSKQGSQHIGIGKKLIQKAESIAFTQSWDKIAIIAGVGVREYYKKLAYELDGTYMVKSLHLCNNKKYQDKNKFIPFIILMIPFIFYLVDIALRYM